MGPDNPRCDECGRADAVTWSPAFTAWLCQWCRWWHTEKLLAAPVTTLPTGRNTP